MSAPVGSTNVTNVTTHAVVFSQQQTSQHHHQHQRQTSNNEKRHRVFLHKNDKRHNVTIFGVMMSDFRFVVVHTMALPFITTSLSSAYYSSEHSARK